MLPDVPLAGWDVAITKEAGVCLLEVNLSCNFFRGTFDQRESWLPDGFSRIFKIVFVWPFGLLDYGSATLRCKI